MKKFPKTKDVADDKLANDLIEQTRSNYETLFNSVNDFLFILDEQGNIIHTNNTVVNRLGYSPEELTGMSVLMMHPPERREEAGRIVGEMLGGITEFCPVPIVTKSGIQIPVETRVTHGSWDGKPALFGITKDISAVKLSEEKFSKVFYLNPSACGISSLDDRKYYEVNQSFCNLFGFDKKEVIGKTASELGIMSDEVIRAIMNNADPLGNVTNAMTDLKAMNGEIKHVLLSSENIYVQDQKFRFTVVNDITEIKRMENAFRNSIRKFEAIIAASPDGIGMASLDGKIQLVSNKLALMHGYSIEEIDEKIGASLLEFIDPSDHALLLENIQRLYSGEIDIKNTEYLAVKKDKSLFYIDLNTTVLRDSNGKPESLLFIERDVTERKKIEQEMIRKNEALATAIAEKDRFFSIIAHDLRSPLSGFLGLTEIMATESPNFSTEEIQNFVVSMRNSATNLSQLIENLLKWSLMEQGLIHFHPKKMLLLSVGKQILSLLNGQAQNKHIELICTISGDIAVFADSDMLQTVMRNIVSNALKFTPRNGTVRLSAQVNLDDQVEILVTDTGVGMDKNLMDNLFKLDALTRRQGTDGENSTGLGLIICKDFIEKHSGTIWVESEVGVGSTFHFTIPRNTDSVGI